MPHYTPKSQIIRVMRKEHAQSNLFLIRLWVDPESQGDEVRDGKHWHGKVQHMNSSMASSFQDWSTLKGLLADMLDANGTSETKGMQITFEHMDETQGPAFPEILP